MRRSEILALLVALVALGGLLDLSLSLMPHNLPIRLTLDPPDGACTGFWACANPD